MMERWGQSPTRLTNHPTIVREQSRCIAARSGGAGLQRLRTAGWTRSDGSGSPASADVAGISVVRASPKRLTIGALADGLNPREHLVESLFAADPPLDTP